MKRLILIIALIATTLGFLLQILVFAQQPATNAQNSTGKQATTTADSASQKEQVDSLAKKQEEGANLVKKNTLLGIIYAAGGFAYFLALDFLLGIIFLAQQFLVLKREMNDAKKIPINEIPKLGYDEIEKMFTQVSEEDTISIEKEKEEMAKLPLLKRIFRRKKASAYQLAHQLFTIFKHQRSTSSFTEVTDSFIQYLKDMFNSFETRLAFLSDTAGALGLLGTVWGMFLLFYQGNFDNERIFSGMGLALATTIIGLAISIVLNTFTTIIANKFDAQLAVINRVKEVFQERFMREEIATGGGSAPVFVDANALKDLKVASTPVAQPASDTASEKTTSRRRSKIRRPAEIKIISGDNQTVEVGKELPEEIEVEVIDEDGKPLEGQEVTFIAEEGAGNFPNDSRIRKILTDEEGRAKTAFTVGKVAGDKKITISLDGSDVQPKSFLVMAKQAPAAKMVEIDGNYQTGELGKRLDRPFVVAIRDKYDNPIPRYEVNFNLVRGSGKFQDSQNAHLTAYTNESGLVEVYFIVGNERGARDIEVEAKRVTPSKLTYEVFAR